MIPTEPTDEHYLPGLYDPDKENSSLEVKTEAEILQLLEDDFFAVALKSKPSILNTSKTDIRAWSEFFKGFNFSDGSKLNDSLFNLNKFSQDARDKFFIKLIEKAFDLRESQKAKIQDHLKATEKLENDREILKKQGLDVFNRDLNKVWKENERFYSKIEKNDIFNWLNFFTHFQISFEKDASITKLLMQLVGLKPGSSITNLFEELKKPDQKENFMYVQNLIASVFIKKLTLEVVKADSNPPSIRAATRSFRTAPDAGARPPDQISFFHQSPEEGSLQTPREFIKPVTTEKILSSTSGDLKAVANSNSDEENGPPTVRIDRTSNAKILKDVQPSQKQYQGPIAVPRANKLDKDIGNSKNVYQKPTLDRTKRTTLPFVAGEDTPIYRSYPLRTKPVPTTPSKTKSTINNALMGTLLGLSVAAGGIATIETLAASNATKVSHLDAENPKPVEPPVQTPNEPSIAPVSPKAPQEIDQQKLRQQPEIIGSVTIGNKTSGLGGEYIKMLLNKAATPEKKDFIKQQQAALNRDFEIYYFLSYGPNAGSLTPEIQAELAKKIDEKPANVEKFEINMLEKGLGPKVTWDLGKKFKGLSNAEALQAVRNVHNFIGAFKAVNGANLTSIHLIQTGKTYNLPEVGGNGVEMFSDATFQKMKDAKTIIPSTKTGLLDATPNFFDQMKAQPEKSSPSQFASVEGNPVSPAADFNSTKSADYLKNLNSNAESANNSTSSTTVGWKENLKTTFGGLFGKAKTALASIGNFFGNKQDSVEQKNINPSFTAQVDAANQRLLHEQKMENKIAQEAEKPQNSFLSGLIQQQATSTGAEVKYTEKKTAGLFQKAWSGIKGLFERSTPATEIQPVPLEKNEVANNVGGLPEFDSEAVGAVDKLVAEKDSSSIKSSSEINKEASLNLLKKLDSSQADNDQNVIKAA